MTEYMTKIYKKAEQKNGKEDSRENKSKPQLLTITRDMSTMLTLRI